MSQFPFLQDLLVVFALSGLVVYLLRTLRLPPIVGLLLAGATMGPHGLSLVEDVHRVEVLAEIGVVLLLFTVGLEFSLDQLLRMWRVLLVGGAGQLFLCAAAVGVCALLWGGSPGQSVFLGCLAALSSTAIVLRLLSERAEMGSPMGRVALGILLFQDLCVVPLMLITPFLAGKGSGGLDLLLTLGRAVLVVVGVVLAARRIVPGLLLRVVRTRSRELFLSLLLVLCLGTAYLTSLAGLSLALGAFLAGLFISESEYSHQALAEAVPFRDAFGSLFFVSIGMLMDVSFVANNLPLVLVVVLVLVLLKTVTAALPALLLGYALPVALGAGLALAQVGEFAFVLSRTGLDLGLIGQAEYQVFLSASVLTMIATPGLIRLGRPLGQRLPTSRLTWSGHAMPDGPGGGHDPLLRDHVVIAGYGVNGQNLARTLKATKIPYAILEMNPETVRTARAKGTPIHYGDCTRAPVLSGLNIEKARLFVVAISDPASQRQSVSIAKSLNPDVYIIVRTRFVSEIDELRRLGAHEVIPEEFETSIEIFARVLSRFSIPKNVILDLVGQARRGMYDMLRGGSDTTSALVSRLPGLEQLQLERLYLKPDSPAVGRTLDELAVRRSTGVTVLAVQRAEEMTTNPAATFELAAGDILVVVGEPMAIDAALALVDPQAPVA